MRDDADDEDEEHEEEEERRPESDDPDEPDTKGGPTTGVIVPGSYQPIRCNSGAYANMEEGGGERRRAKKEKESELTGG